MTPEQRPPPAVRGERCASAPTLTDAQRAFAAEHHGLIYAFLNKERWPEDDYYDIAAFGFLHAVFRYDKQPELSRFNFSTIAWANMRQSVAAYRRRETRRRESERRYAELAAKAADPFEEFEYTLVLHELARASHDGKKELAQLRLQGYSIAEIAQRRGMSAYRVRRLLRELFQVYLKLNK